MIRLRTGIQLSLVALGMLLSTGLPDLLHAQGRSRHSLRIISPAPYTLGDTLEVSLDITIASGEAVIAASGYLTLDPDVFFPVLWPNGLPFKEGALLNNAADINGMHGDSLHLAHDANSYTDGSGRYYNGWGWQLSYFQQTPPESPRPTIPGPLGPVSIATFRFEVRNLPSDASFIPTIGYEYNDIFHRNSQYSILVSEGTSTEGPYANMPYTLQVPLSGVAIRPAMPDTVVIPGNGLDILLSDHFSSNVLDSSFAEWDISFYNVPLGGPTPIIINQIGPNARLQLNTGAGDQYIIEANLQLSALDTSESPPIYYYDDQDFTIFVDVPPTFIAPVDTIYVFDEDVPLKVLGNGGVFSDTDNSGLDFTVRLEPDSLVHVAYGADDSLMFYADTNAYGSQVARLYIEDSLGLSIDTVLYFTVNSVNDTPYVNFDGFLNGPRDTLITHRGVVDTVDLPLYGYDVEDGPIPLWNVINPSGSVTTTIFNDNQLRIVVDSAAVFTDVLLTIEGTDGSGLTGSDTLVLSIRSWPPVITALNDLAIRSGPDTTFNVLNWAVDNDTDPANFTWTFEVLSAADTLTVDDSVTTDYIQAAQTLTFLTDSGYAALDVLRMIVKDDDTNRDTAIVFLGVFASFDPIILPIPLDTVYMATTEDVLDLDDYVLDPQYTPDQLTWTIIGGGANLQGASINSSTHILQIQANSTFYGYDSLNLKVENPDGLADTAYYVVRVLPPLDQNFAPRWVLPTLGKLEVKYPDTLAIFNLYASVYDDFTLFDDLILTFVPEGDTLKPLIAIIDTLTWDLSITAPALATYPTWFYITAEDEQGLISTSDTVYIDVVDSYSPIWSNMPLLRLKPVETLRIPIDQYLSDRDTDSSLITVSVTKFTSAIDASFDPATRELVVTSKGIKLSTSLRLLATDDLGNYDIITVQLLVEEQIDRTPPDGDLTYFFNPAADRWIHYVVAADSTTDISRFTWHYAYGTPPRDWSDHLSFVMQDTLPGTVTWIAPYHFQNEGSYVLTVVITDAVNNLIDPSPSLPLSVGFSKAIGGVLASPDQQLTVTYPPALIPNGKLLIISESSLSDSSGQTTAEIASAGVNKKAASQILATVYSLDTNLPKPILVTLTYHQKRDVDPYYSFYALDGEQLVKIETYTSTDGHFEAAAKLDRDIVFAPSDTPARNAPLPDAELFCYPNPFNATIQVRFLLRWPDRGRIVIYNLLGREVYTSPRQLLKPGVHAFSWHSIDKRGLPAPSGVYFIRLETDGGKIVTRKVTLLK